ncbi:hypothetical protein VOLCADRAFT_106430 [Volvox carteri f. nagariensis]|uniref:Uncharacterized protein n=1 Tax=Volvox carteri f. nagariensis TaxID=3068 RepID=D8U799_VOLCA|nr:uncharacterized protein VOLCADRAFT_106430 [Volvox carteri f. nagariensis]EFJ44447.1 hypothetical protein VOLCADRAFT_106430 [Volvox carteri f. nagariensis]|eukprot:XP_002954554.1 hypothetical protein VOLCADRAFT_106430 [Volvox carteri f. nagariensis]
MSYILRIAGGQPNFRPRPGPKADHRPRAASSAAGPIASGQSPAPAPPPQGNFPVWCLPLLVASAAMPIYGYKKQMKLIEEARARQRAGVVAAATPASAPVTKTGK